MVKKRSQKGVENSGEKINNDTNVSNAENSNNANESEHKINIKQPSLCSATSGMVPCRRLWSLLHMPMKSAILHR